MGGRSAQVERGSRESQSIARSRKTSHEESRFRRKRGFCSMRPQHILDLCLVRLRVCTHWGASACFVVDSGPGTSSARIQQSQATTCSRGSVSLGRSWRLTLHALFWSEGVACDCESCDDELDNVCDPALEQRARLASERQNGRVERAYEGGLLLQRGSDLLENPRLLLAVCGRAQRRAEEQEHLVGGRRQLRLLRRDSSAYRLSLCHLCACAFAGFLAGERQASCSLLFDLASIQHQTGNQDGELHGRQGRRDLAVSQLLISSLPSSQAANT